MKKPYPYQRGVLAAMAMCVAGLGMLSAFSDPAPTTEPVRVAQEGKYIGAAKCKSCHQAEEKGNQYQLWEESPHAKAFETLGSEAAKKIAAERGIEDPQKAPECLKCHTTAFGVDEKQIKRGFKPEMGVQCESCHGPGDGHMKARFKATAAEQADAKPEPGEVLLGTGQDLCLQCHNAESPTFKPFCYYERLEAISHPRPDSTRPVLVCGCDDPCGCKDSCPDDGCGVEKK